jgi:ribose transport system substrate-binding protein
LRDCEGALRADTLCDRPQRRAQFNKDILAEAAKHPEVELIVTDGEDKTEKQVADVENLIRQDDALLVSPKESAGLTGVV